MAQKNYSSQIDGKIYNVTLQAEISEATTAVKFPCLFYVLWKTNDQHYIAETGRYSQQAGKVNINQTITLTLPLIYQRSKQVFLKKQTQLQLNLISKSRPDQPKLVGRVTLDLANLINNNLYPTITEFPLQFCSVNATLKASFKVLEKIQTDISQYELEKSMGDGMSFTSGLKAITIPASVEKSRDSISFGRDVSPIHSRITMDRNFINRELASRNASPKPFEQEKTTKEQDSKEKKEMSSSTTQEKGEGEDKSRTKSFSGAKINGLIENCHKKLGSVLSEESRLSDETLKLRGEIDALRLESSRQHEEDERIRKDLQRKLKDNEYVKLELRQKQTQLDQSNSENSVLRNESVKLREQIGRLREQVVAGTIKIAELKDNYNRVAAQLSTSERELKRLDIASEQSSEANKNYSQRIQQLQRQLREMEAQCGELQTSKADLILSLTRKEDEYVKKVDDQKKVLETLEAERISWNQEIERLKQQLEKGTEDNNQSASKLRSLEQEVKRLTAVEHDFEEARHSWSLTEGLVTQESSKRGERVTELEQALMSINERVRWLEGENELLNENCRKSREEIVRLQEDKVECLKEGELKYEACFSNLEEERNNIINLLNEKSALEDLLATANSKLESLSSDHEILTNDHVALIEKQKDLLIASEEQRQKIQELEELLLSGNQQKEKELSAAAQRENSLEITVKELQQALQRANETILGLESKARVLEEELQGREDLIMKLQEGLNTQIERTESLNSKLITYFQKDEKMKDLSLVLEEEERKLNDLMNDQEANEVRYINLINQRENAIEELATQLEASQQYGKELLVVIGEKEKDYDGNLKALEGRLSEITKLSQEFRQLHSISEKRVGELQSTIIDLENNQREVLVGQEAVQKELRATIQLLQVEKDQMVVTISELESNVESLNLKITEKEDVILSEMERINSLNETVVEKEAQISELEGLIQEKETVMAELQASKAELQNQLSIKDEIVQEENRRFNELQQLYDTLANDVASFDVMVWKDEMREKNEQIKKLEADIVMLGTQVSKTASIERSLKIKTIELNSLKFKGKTDPSETNELVRLKDEEISALQAERDSLAKVEREFLKLQQEVEGLRGQLQEIEEERFNIESLSNERALLLEQAKEQNRKLIDQLTIIGEKHGELEKIIFETTSADQPQSQTASESKNQALRSKVVDLEQTNQQLRQQLQTNISNAKPSNSDVSGLLSSVKKALQDRGKGKMQEKVIQSIEKIVTREAGKSKTLEEKTKVLSKDFGRLKVQMMRLGEGKDSSKMVAQLKNCENILTSMASLLS